MQRTLQILLHKCYKLECLFFNPQKNTYIFIMFLTRHQSLINMLIVSFFIIKLIAALAIYIASCSSKFYFVSIYTQKNPYNKEMNSLNGI